MSIFEEYKDKTDQEIIAMMEKIGNSGTDNLAGVHILQSILDLRAGKVSKWHKSYFLDKIFPLIVAGVISFAVGYSLKVVEVRKLKVAVQTLETRESRIQSEIKDAITSGDPSKITAMFDRLNRQSSISQEDKRQLRILEYKADDLGKKRDSALAKNDSNSLTIITDELVKTLDKIRRLKE